MKNEEILKSLAHISEAVNHLVEYIEKHVEAPEPKRRTIKVDRPVLEVVRALNSANKIAMINSVMRGCNLFSRESIAELLDAEVEKGTLAKVTIGEAKRLGFENPRGSKADQVCWIVASAKKTDGRAVQKGMK